MGLLKIMKHLNFWFFSRSCFLLLLRGLVFACQGFLCEKLTGRSEAGLGPKAIEQHSEHGLGL